MSDEKQETVAGIVAEMRSNKFDDPRFNIFKVLAARELAREYADRIEAAHKREREATCEKSSQVGNAEKMREALKKIHNLLGRMDLRYEVSYQMVKKALAAPSRNCDAFSKDKVLEMLEDRSFSKEDTIEWLYAEAKGEMK